MKKDIVEMTDGTKYIALSNYNSMRGYYIDQIIIVDDFRWNIYSEKYKLIDLLEHRLSCISCVPEEFLKQEYEW